MGSLLHGHLALFGPLDLDWTVSGGVLDPRVSPGREPWTVRVPPGHHAWPVRTGLVPGIGICVFDSVAAATQAIPPTSRGITG